MAECCGRNFYGRSLSGTGRARYELSDLLMCLYFFYDINHLRMSVAAKRRLREESTESEYVYVFDDASFPTQPCFKVGISTRAPEFRLTELNRGRPTKLGFVYAATCYHAHPAEQIVHKLLEDFRVPNTEFFAGVPEHVVVNLVRAVCDLNKISRGPSATPMAQMEEAFPDAPPSPPSPPVPQPSASSGISAASQETLVDDEVSNITTDDPHAQKSADLEVVRNATFFQAIMPTGTSFEDVRGVFASVDRKLQKRNPQCALFLEKESQIVCFFSEGSDVGTKQKALRTMQAVIAPISTYNVLVRTINAIVKPPIGVGAKLLGHFRCPDALVEKCNIAPAK